MESPPPFNLQEGSHETGQNPPPHNTKAKGEKIHIFFPHSDVYLCVNVRKEREEHWRQCLPIVLGTSLLVFHEDTLLLPPFFSPLMSIVLYAMVMEDSSESRSSPFSRSSLLMSNSNSCVLCVHAWSKRASNARDLTGAGGGDKESGSWI
jgi:hypothetical protein